jgi:hypothetical protein
MTNYKKNIWLLVNLLVADLLVEKESFIECLNTYQLHVEFGWFVLQLILLLLCLFGFIVSEGPSMCRWRTYVWLLPLQLDHDPILEHLSSIWLALQREPFSLPIFSWKRFPHIMYLKKIMYFPLVFPYFSSLSVQECSCSYDISIC